MAVALGIIGFIVLFAGVFALESLLTTRATIYSPAGERFEPGHPMGGPCAGEPIHKGGHSFMARPGYLSHRNKAGSREFMR